MKLQIKRKSPDFWERKNEVSAILQQSDFTDYEILHVFALVIDQIDNIMHR